MPEYGRFERCAGEGVHRSTEDPAMYLVGDVVPDWVDVPAGAGGGRRTVESHRMITCPGCQGHETRELSLGDGLCVAECPERGFLWYRRRAP